MAKDSSVSPFIHSRCAHCFWWWKTILGLRIVLISITETIIHSVFGSIVYLSFIGICIVLREKLTEWEWKEEEANPNKDERRQSYGTVMIRNLKKKKEDRPRQKPQNQYIKIKFIECDQTNYVINSRMIMHNGFILVQNVCKVERICMYLV